MLTNLSLHVSPPNDYKEIACLLEHSLLSQSNTDLKLEMGRFHEKLETYLAS